MSGMSLVSRKEIADQDLDLAADANYKLMLVDENYVHSDTRDFVDSGDASSPADHELSTDNYVGGFGGSGRRVPTGRVVSRNDGDARIEFTHDPETWVELGPSSGGPIIGGVVHIIERTNDEDSIIVGFDSLVENQQTNGGDVTYEPHADGVFNW